MKLNFLKYFTSTADREELERLESWKKESQENLNHIQQIQAIHNASEDMKGYKAYDTIAAYNQITGKPLTIEKKMSSKNIWYAAAATLFLAFAASSWLYLKNNTTLNSVYTTTTESKQILLHDGTEVTLDNNSQLILTKDRAVNLSGRAYFKVAKKLDKAPFTVSFDKGMVTVLGTEFSIRNDSTTTEVAVAEGHVKYDYDDRSVHLFEGEMAVLVNNDIVKTSRNEDQLFSWKMNELVFKDTYLNDAINELNRYYKSDIVIKEGLTMSNTCKLTTKFKNESIGQAMKELSSLLGITYHMEGNKYVITSIKCK